jgi:hypothetical protein
VKRRPVRGVHGVQRDAYQCRLDHRAVGECEVEVGRIEVGQPIPQGEIRRRGLLRLQRDRVADGVDDLYRFTTQQHLPAERGPVELSFGEAHTSPCALRRQYAAHPIRPPRESESA